MRLRKVCGRFARGVCLAMPVATRQSGKDVGDDHDDDVVNAVWW